MMRGRSRRAESVLILNWRDTANPEGGGSEVYVEEIAAQLAAQGRRVTLFCAAHPSAPRKEYRDGVRILRRGSRLTVYVWAFIYHMLGKFGEHDVVVDVQNGIPFMSALYCHRPVVVLVHHLHKEQWGMIFGPRTARLGWWIESRLSPFIHRRHSYVTVSEATRRELVALAVPRDAIRLVRNGTRIHDAPAPPKTDEPSICVLSRLVPHKRIECVLQAAVKLRQELPGLKVRVLGRGYWEGELRALARELRVEDAVEFRGWVDEDTKRQILAESWVLAMPSVKEGWGLAVIEAASEGTPAVGFHGAGGLSESIVEEQTGLLAEDLDGFRAALRRFLVERDLRTRCGEAARRHAAGFSWADSAVQFAQVLDQQLASETARLADETLAFDEGAKAPTDTAAEAQSP